MRLVVRYTKREKVKYISHLDFIRLVQRAMRRADIPVAYSQGFNPHPRLSFASALAVGITSEGEYLDVFLEKDMEPQLLCHRMNEKLPEGIRFIESVKLDEKSPSLMSVIERAEYIIKISSIPFQQYDIISLVDEFLSQTEILITRENRRGSRQVDVRQMIHSMEVIEQNEEDITIKTMISAGSKANLRPELLVDALLNFAKISLEPELFLCIHRLNLYFSEDGRWRTPIEMG